MNDLKTTVRNHLKPSRYNHTLGVCKLAVHLAKLYEVNEKDAEIASLLHDYCKYESDEAILETYRRTNKPICDVIKNHPNLGHGYMSAIIAKEQFGVSDDIFHAIMNHTFGRPHMSMLEKIIYLSDALEEGRSYEGIEILRELVQKDINKALIMACQNTLIFELKRGNMIHVQTILMLNALVAER